MTENLQWVLYEGKISFSDVTRDMAERKTPPIQPFYFGLDFILNHFQEPIFPRTISTKATENGQHLVYSKEEALARFQQADILDCKINAYPNRIEWKGLNRQAPNFIFIDLDLGKFRSRLALDRHWQRL